jgi:hypothetical protein
MEVVVVVVAAVAGAVDTTVVGTMAVEVEAWDVAVCTEALTARVGVAACVTASISAIQFCLHCLWLHIVHYAMQWS